MIKPILFNTDMVQAILDGRKTVTRRCVKGFIPNDAIWGYTMFTPKGHISCRGYFVDEYGEKFFKPPYQPGDILYVRETWCKANETCGMASIDCGECHSGCGYLYKATPDQCFVNEETQWHPSIHMPKEAARIWLKVTDVRVERLQDITAEQVVKEGITEFDMEHIKTLGEHYDIPFAALWDSTIKKSDLDRYGWETNPWVWRIAFERCKKPEEV